MILFSRRRLGSRDVASFGKVGRRALIDVFGGGKAIGLALLRLEAVSEAAGKPLTAGDARLTPRKPAWASLSTTAGSSSRRERSNHWSESPRKPRAERTGWIRPSMAR